MWKATTHPIRPRPLIWGTTDDFASSSLQKQFPWSPTRDSPPGVCEFQPCPLWCCLPTRSSSVYLFYFPLSWYLAIWFCRRSPVINCAMWKKIIILLVEAIHFVAVPSYRSMSLRGWLGVKHQASISLSLSLCRCNPSSLHHFSQSGSVCYNHYFHIITHRLGCLAEQHSHMTVLERNGTWPPCQ